LRFYETVCTFFAVLPFSVIKTGNIGLAATLAAYLVLLLIVLRPKYVPMGLITLVICIFLRVYPLGLHITVLDESAVIRHRNKTWTAGNLRDPALARYMAFANIRSSESINNNEIISFGDTRIAFGFNETDMDADMVILPRRGNIAAAGEIIFDTKRDGAITIQSNGRKIKVFANFRQKV
jgi:hypothetical protein